MQRKPALRNAIPVAQAPFMRGPKRRDKVVGSGRVGSGPRRFKTAATSSVQMSAPSPGSKRSQPASKKTQLFATCPTTRVELVFH